jgi:hypothetical protein
MFSFPKSKGDGADAGKADPLADQRCSFCGKAPPAVGKLIAGPTVFICDECVDVCVDVLTADRDLQQAEVSATDLQRTGVAGLLRERAVACALCGNVDLPNGMLAVGDRGILCGECADAVEDALAQGKPTS